MLKQFLFPNIDDTDADDMWLQQDGAPCDVIQLMKQSICWRESIVKPVFRKMDQSSQLPGELNALQDNIEGVIADIQPDLCMRESLKFESKEFMLQNEAVEMATTE